MRYLVDFKNGTSQQDIDNYLASNGCTVIKEWDNFDQVYLVETNNALPNEPIIERLVEEVGLKIKPMDIVKYESMDTHFGCHSDPTKPKITLSTTDTKDWWKNYSYATPKFETPSYEISRLGKNVNIYLMDSGIQSSHPEFTDASIVNLYTVTPGDFGDTRGHGTALASLMVGKTCGITNATVKNVKIFDPNHDTLQSEFLSALDAIISDHVDGTFSILNCSWIIEKNEYVEHKLQILNEEGVFIVASAGNQGTSIEDVTPASMMEALTIGAYNKDLLPCDFSNYTGTSSISVTGGATNHGELDGWAPGEEIWAASLDGSCAFVAGTSASAAITSAIIASNLSWWAFSAGEIHPWYKDHVDLSTGSAMGWEYIFCFTKTDMLDLSNPKYADSKNILAGMKDKCASPSVQFPDEVTLSARIDAPHAYIIGSCFNPNATKHIEWVNPLPENFYLLPDGLITAQPSHDQGPLEGEISRKYVATFNRTNSDDSVELVTINIFVVSADLTQDQVPDDDPVLKVSLQFTCNTPTLSCYLQTISGCVYSCGGGVPCCGVQCGKGFYNCFCFPCF